MPWVDENGCTGCGICAEECPAETISIKNEKAQIDMANCIRCGNCHDICPENAVRHDSEKIPEQVEANIAWAKDCMDSCAEHFNDESERGKCLKRIIKYFNKEKAVADKTLARLQMLDRG